MPDLRLGKLSNHAPTKLTLNLWSELDEHLSLYAELYSAQNGMKASAADIAPQMLAEYLESDREFVKILKAPKAKAS